MIKKILNFIRTVLWEIKQRITTKVGDYFRVIYTNDTKELLTGVIFGYDSHFLRDNYGSDLGIKIRSGFQNGTYARLIAQSTNQFKIKKLRCYSDNSRNLLSEIIAKYSNNEGQTYTRPLKKRTPLRKICDYIKTIDFNDTITINTGSEISFQIEPESYMDFLIYPFPPKKSIADIIKQSYRQTFKK